ncbi:MarR family winged helix-turn-helix transcriptional regulator [Rubripirellula reticaptiva]|uniref:HTH-type transcriptional regulator MhqR n=1 Tax=Rubripirellula reticaptiva TaxID=2528013 RepID=A0A5C6EG86_9BACT|nr:MarR family transcriptional regulator [Rubripirellula reticaptiva]TWU46761.1 HTH-type transcriptional regulator MhqR [Rubripirellula reticaptiva]
MTSSLQNELRKRAPFDSVEQEATLALMRTSDLLENRFARLLRESGLTLSQYNVLRILRGEGKAMPCLEVADRMIQVAPAITRVVDQLIGLELIVKTQSQADRRVFYIELTAAAKRLLKKLDGPILNLHANLLDGVPKNQLGTLIEILERVRNSVKN